MKRIPAARNPATIAWMARPDGSMEGKTTHTTDIVHIVNSKTQDETGTFSKEDTVYGKQEKKFCF